VQLYLTFYEIILILMASLCEATLFYLKGRFSNFAVVVTNVEKTVDRSRWCQYLFNIWGGGWEVGNSRLKSALVCWFCFVAPVWSSVKYQLLVVNIYFSAFRFRTSLSLTVIGKIKEVVNSKNFCDFALTAYDLNDCFSNAL
jgi:hypothetical protein